MTDEQACLFAAPSWYHDTQQTEELVEKGQVEARLGLRRRHLWCRTITQTRRTGRLQEQSPVRLESGAFCRIYCNTRGRILVRHVYRPRSIFASNTRVPSQQPLPALSLPRTLLPPSDSTVASADNRKGEEYRSDESCEARRTPNLQLRETQIFL